MTNAPPGYDFSTGARPRALLFDWDNTLVDTWDVITDALNAVYDAFGLPHWTIADAKARIRESMREAFPKTFGDRAKDAGRIFSDYFALHHLERLRAMPGAGELLQALAGSGLHLGVVSNKRGRFLRLEAEHLGWTGHFARLVGAADTSLDKPAVEPVELALSSCAGPRSGSSAIPTSICAARSMRGVSPFCSVPSRRRPGSSTPIRPQSICRIAPGSRHGCVLSGFCRPRICDRQPRSRSIVFRSIDHPVLPISRLPTGP